MDGETGQYYYRARYYDAAVGRFVSSDPIGFAAGDTNLYRYVFNSPTNFTDPSGNFAVAVPVVVGGGLLLLGGAYILNNPQAREVVRDLPKHLPSLLNNLNPFRVDPVANDDVMLRERFPKRTPVDGVGGVGGFNDGARVYFPDNTGHPGSSGVETGTRPFPGNVPLDRPHVEIFPGCYEPQLSPPFFNSENFVPGFGAGANLPSMDGMSPSQARQNLTNGGFTPTKPIPSDGGWQTFKHPDKSKIDIHWTNGRVVRSEAPIYGPDGRKINGGQRLDSSGRRIPRALDHSEHPTETIDISQP